MTQSVSMTRREMLLGWSYLLISVFVLPSALLFANSCLKSPLSDGVINLLFFGINFLCVTGIFHRFLRASVQAALSAPGRCLRFAALGFLVYWLAVTVLGRLTLWIQPDFSNVNDASISQLSQEYPVLWAIATVFLVPVSEEFLYRGLLFHSLRRKSRAIGYLLSTLVFAGIHVMGYIGISDPLTLLLCFAQYLPAGICLGWAYERAGTVIAPILIHITVNQIGIAAMR